jgi:hypothetical protein
MTTRPADPTDVRTARRPRGRRHATWPGAPVRPLAGALAGALLALAGGVVGATPAHAAARVDVSGLDGRAAADPSGATTLTLRGSGFQSVSGGFGGIYVMFGWVSGSWRPSAGGVTGDDLRYVPDSESADNAGHQRFVAFPGSDTAAAANGGVVEVDGTWSTTLVVPGARFATVDRSGASTTVDCLQVTCGVITIGAHGVKNAANETFTPVTFAGASAAPAAAPAAGATDDARAAEGAAQEAPAVDPAAATLGVDQATAVLGRAMSFTGQGFLPGEQVVGSVDDGRLAVGPLAAGPHGEVAGFVELPADLRTGTHVLELRGAASGAAPQAQFTATKDPALVSAQEAAEAAADAAPTGPTWQEVAVGVAALVLVAVVVSSAVAGARRRRARRAPARPDPAPAAPASSGTTPTGPTSGTAPAAPATPPVRNPRRGLRAHRGVAVDDAPTAPVAAAPAVPAGDEVRPSLGSASVPAGGAR